VSECNYWLEDGNKQWCDLSQGSCSCLGNDSTCSMGGGKVTTALRAEKQAVTREAALRAQRKKMHAFSEGSNH
jgi:hypothetical protein